MEILRGMEVKITGVIHRLILKKKNDFFFFNFFFFFFLGGGGIFVQIIEGGGVPRPPVPPPPYSYGPASINIMEFPDLTISIMILRTRPLVFKGLKIYSHMNRTYFETRAILHIIHSFTIS